MASNGQTNPKMFYLVECTSLAQTRSAVPLPCLLAKPCLVPWSTIENDNIFYDPPVAVGQLRNDAAAIIDSIEGATLTFGWRCSTGSGQPGQVTCLRVRFTGRRNNIYQFFGVDISAPFAQRYQTVLVLHPQPRPRTHTLHFEATSAATILAWKQRRSKSFETCCISWA